MGVRHDQVVVPVDDRAGGRDLRRRLRVGRRRGLVVLGTLTPWYARRETSAMRSARKPFPRRPSPGLVLFLTLAVAGAAPAAADFWYQYWDRHLTFESSYFARLNYVNQNPVKHGLVGIASNYPFCSAGWFELRAEKSFRKRLATYGYSRVKEPDDFEPIWVDRF